MFKKAICLFLTISLLIPPGAYARRTEMSHERFVHLTDEEKNQLLVLTMEMMAELEQNYTYETSVNGHSEELHQKYTSIMKKLYDFLISEAGADEKKGMEWKQYAEKFRGALDDNSASSKKDDKCFFAGWPSKIQLEFKWVDAPAPAETKKPVGNTGGAANPVACNNARAEMATATAKYQDDLQVAAKVPMHNKAQAAKLARIPYDAAVAKAGKACATEKVEAPTKPKKIKKYGTKKYCVVPNQIEDQKSPEYKAYKEHQDKMAKGAKCKSTEISCNPSIFGFKAAAYNTVFCVPSALGSPAENASHSCMKKALADPAPEGTDSKNDRLKTLRAALEANPDYVTSIYEYMEKLCLCDKKDLDAKIKGKVNDAYLGKIKPHRTCYALMEMMGQTLDCSTPAKPDMDLSLFTKLKEYTAANSAKLYNQDGKGKDSIEEHYKKYLEEVGSSEQYKYLCKGEKKPEPVVEKPKVKGYTCKVEEPCVEKKAVPASGDGVAAETSGAAAAATTGVGPTAPAAPGASTSAAAATISCPAKIFEEGKNEAIASLTAEGLAGSEVDQEFKTGNAEDKAKVKCTLPAFKKEESAQKCVIKLEGEEKDISATVSLDEKDNDKFEMVKFAWDNKGTANPAKYTRDPLKELTVNVTVELKSKPGGKDSTTSCEAKKEPKKADDKDPGLDVTAGPTTDTQQNAIAKASGKLDGWKLVWEDKGDGAPAIEEKKVAAVAGDTPAPAAPADASAKKVDPAPAVPAEKKPTKFTQTEDKAKPESKLDRPRGKADYEICAKLVKGEKAIGPKCVPVAKLKEAAPPPPPPTPEKGGKSGFSGGMPSGGAAPTPFRGNTKYGNAGTN